MLWFDTTIFMLTFIKAIQMRTEISGGLLETMFRDGTELCEIPGLHTCTHVTLIIVLRDDLLRVSNSEEWHMAIGELMGVSLLPHSILVVVNVVNIVTFLVRILFQTHRKHNLTPTTLQVTRVSGNQRLLVIISVDLLSIEHAVRYPVKGHGYHTDKRVSRVQSARPDERPDTASAPEGYPLRSHRD